MRRGRVHGIEIGIILINLMNIFARNVFEGINIGLSSAIEDNVAEFTVVMTSLTVVAKRDTALGYCTVERDVIKSDAFGHYFQEQADDANPAPAFPVQVQGHGQR